MLFWGCVYTTTDCPALPLCVSTVDSVGLLVQTHPNMLRVVLKKNEKRAGKAVRDPPGGSVVFKGMNVTRKFNSYTVQILTDLEKSLNRTSVSASGGEACERLQSFRCQDPPTQHCESSCERHDLTASAP